MNQGKIMEQAWRKAAKKVPGLYFQRMNDGTASYSRGGEGSPVRFQQKNPYDCFMHYKGKLFLLELKHHKGASLPFTAIREQQLAHLAQASVAYDDVIAGFVVMFADSGECFFANGNAVAEFENTSERKSIPISWFRENALGIPVRKLKTNWEYNVLEFVKLFDGGKNSQCCD